MNAEDTVKELSDKVAVVTGGASGIGKSIGLALAEKGTHVVVADIEPDTAEAAAQEIARAGVRTLAVQCDVADMSAVEHLAKRAWSHFGHVELLFNNAGVASGGPLLDSTANELHWLFDVNVFGVWHGCRVFGQRFRSQGTPAHIVNTGSEHSLGIPSPQAGFYTATKHAVLALSDVLRREVPDNIGVSVLCPGIVQTDIWNAARNRPQAFGGPEEGAPQTQVMMEYGMDAREIGRQAVAGVERGDFYIVTHSHVRKYVEERATEILAAFDKQAPYKEGDDRYEVDAIIARMMAATQKSES